MLNAIQQYASNPEYASRALAIVSAAMYDAENSVSGVSNYVYVHVTAPQGSSDIAAVAQAAHDAMVYLYPAQQSASDAQLATSLASVSDPAARANGISVGQQVAAAIIAMRANDGATNYVDYTPGTGNGVWQPTYPAYMPAENPQWATLTPFMMTSDSQFRPAGPPALGSAQWVSDYNQVKSLGAVNSTTAHRGPNANRAVLERSNRYCHATGPLELDRQPVGGLEKLDSGRHDQNAG